MPGAARTARATGTIPHPAQVGAPDKRVRGIGERNGARGWDGGQVGQQGLPFTDTDLAVWLAAGENLYQYGAQPRCEQQRIPPEETVILSHSHGLQPVLVAAAKRLQIHTFVDVAGPVRKDMRAIAEAARPQIQRWVHIHAGHRDRMQWLGELCDGHLGVVREHPLADENVSVPQADHSEVRRRPQYFPVIARAVLGTVERAT